MTLKRFKTCRTCGKQEPRGWTESADYVCAVCREKTVAEVFDPLVAHRSITQTPEQMKQAQRVADMMRKFEQERKDPTALRSDPTRRALRNQGDDLDPLNPLSLTSPLNPVYHVNDRNDWDDSSHRHHSSHDSDSSPSYDSGDSSTPSGGACD
ncbi:hypothetical protein ABR33_06110 [Enterobacter bugandensis]|uniref:hypothetical protein n=1 Tax=Enterobacter bugandensis TaxID=881260 RepID=UPI000659C2A1|nr:hypothetical protein [Enterobacter bugandensis]KLQ32563.1 hypothetical protein ABR33_06110 [Enterobacter bugandensis]